MSEEPQSVRPRYGALHRANGETRTVYFLPHESMPDTFVAHYADDEEVAVVDAKGGDRIYVDVIGPGQSIYIQYPSSAEPVRGRLKKDKENDMNENNNKPRNPNGWWQGLVVLASLVVIIVLGIKGVVWALG